MTRTMVKNGSKVQRALHHLSARPVESRGHVYVTVGQVAQEAGCSRPTALKYLKILQRYEIARGDQLHNGLWMWAWAGNA